MSRAFGATEVDLDDAERVGEHSVLWVRLALDLGDELLCLHARLEPLDYVTDDVTAGAG